MNERIWGTSDDGRFSFVSLTAQRLKEVFSVFRNGFFTRDVFCMVTEITRDPYALSDTEELLRRIALDGVSLVAVDNYAQKVIGCILNKIQVKYDHQFRMRKVFDEVTCNSEASKAYLKIHTDLYNFLDLFNYFDTLCYFEPMFLSILPSYRNRAADIKCSLIKHSIKIAEALKNRNNYVRVPIDSCALYLDNIPTMMIALSNSEQISAVYHACGFAMVKNVNLLNQGNNTHVVFETDASSSLLQVFTKSLQEL